MDEQHKKDLEIIGEELGMGAGVLVNIVNEYISLLRSDVAEDIKTLDQFERRLRDTPSAFEKAARKCGPCPDCSRPGIRILDEEAGTLTCGKCKRVLLEKTKEGQTNG